MTHEHDYEYLEIAPQFYVWSCVCGESVFWLEEEEKQPTIWNQMLKRLLGLLA